MAALSTIREAGSGSYGIHDYVSDEVITHPYPLDHALAAPASERAAA